MFVIDRIKISDRNKSIYFLVPRKRHHEDDPYSSTDSSDPNLRSHSIPKRLATGDNVQSSCSSRPAMVDADLSPTSSSGSDVSTTTTTLSNDTYPTLCSHIQLCRCPSKDCVVHGNNSVPLDLTTDRNPTYGKTNLLLYYAHLERCRRHGTQIHENCSSSSTFESLHK